MQDRNFHVLYSLPDNFYHCTVHFNIHTVHSPTDAHLLKSLITVYIKLDGYFFFTCFGLRPSSGSFSIEPG